MGLARVTVLGTNHAHLAARAAVLKHFWSVNTITPDDEGLLGIEADVMVVCNSLPEAERQHWVDLLRERWPAMLIVRMNGFDAGPHMAADATVDEAHGPGALVSTIYGLVTERGIESRKWPVEPDAAWLQ